MADLSQRKLDSALEHLNAARQEMAGLLSVSGDWTTSTEIEAEFDALRERCREVVQRQFGGGGE